MAKEVRLSDIADSLHVSTVTVSKALSGKKGVSEKMRQKIKSVAQEMGYEAIVKTRQERTEKGYTIGVIVAERYLDKYNSFYLNIYQMVVQRAMTKQCFTLMETITEAAETGLKLPEIMKEEKADGIIVLGRMSQAYLKMLDKKSDVPLIYLDFCDEKHEKDAVISDNYYGAYQMTNYLFEMGHKTIGYVGTLLSTGSITDRYLGYLRSLMEHGVSVNEKWVINDREGDHGSIDPDKFLELPDELPDAFFCNCDIAAGYLIRKLEERGLKVPEDISVAGYDNYLYPGMCDIGITTYEVDAREMAKKAVLTLIRKIDGEEPGKKIYIVVGHMVLKESVRQVK